MTTSITRTIRRSLASLLATATLVVGYLVITTPMATSAAHADYRNDYIAAHISDAQAVERAFGVPASVALAQSILESGWGQSGLAVNDNNYFGIKCFGGVITSPYTDSCSDWPTKEYYNGWVTVYAKFRHYNSPQRSFEDYGNFLKVNSRYANAFNYSNDADQFIREVHAAGYATDPDYSSSVINLMTKWGLYQYNLYNQPAPAPEPAPAPAPEPAPAPAPEPEPAPAPVVTPEPAPVVTPTPEPAPVVTPTPEPTPVVTPTPEPEPAPVVAPEPAPVVVETPTPAVITQVEPVQQAQDPNIASIGSTTVAVEENNLAPVAAFAVPAPLPVISSLAIIMDQPLVTVVAAKNPAELPLKFVEHNGRIIEFRGRVMESLV